MSAANPGTFSQKVGGGASVPPLRDYEPNFGGKMWDSRRLENLRRMFEEQLGRELTPEEFRLLSLTESLDDPEADRTLRAELPKEPKKAAAS